MADAAWLEALQPGDVVVRQYGYAHTSMRLLEVERLTPKQLVVRDPRTGAVFGRYWRDSGMVVGSGFATDMLLEATPQRRAAIREQEVLERLTSVKWEAVPAEKRAAVIALLDAKEGQT